MRRTQIYLEEHDHLGAQLLARKEESTVSDVIRLALRNHLAAKAEKFDWKENLLSGYGLWKDRPEVEDEIRAFRESLDRDLFGDRP